MAFIAVAGLLCAFPALGSAQSRLSEKGSAALLRMMEQGNQPVEYLVYFQDSVDLSGARVLARKADKTRFVYERLREQALRSQAAAGEILRQAGAKFRPHYLLNALEVSSQPAAMEKLAALQEVRQLREVVRFRQKLPIPSLDPVIAPEGVQSIEWGVSRVRAPQVWNSLGIRGEGIVVAQADTGVQWDHPALKSHYRGWSGGSANHNYNWHDAIHNSFVNPCGNDSQFPCDDSGHGTHVTGTMAGDDGAGNQIGVAPGAKWIACRNMDHGTGTIARYAECLEFFLAPYPLNSTPFNGRPDLAADIVSNSWSCTPGEGCDAAHLNDLRTMVQSLELAGIFVVAAAGNEGPGCGSVVEPLAIYPETFAVGAVQLGDSLATFSSRGPVTVDGIVRRKPDISAPGVGIRSSYYTPGGGSSYHSLGGTSMASPHVAGVAALLWSAVPGCHGDIARTKQILQWSADRITSFEGCGGDSGSAIPNNSYGYGIVNAWSAIQFARRVFLPLVLRNSNLSP